jgi:hypothetical protein
MEEATLTAVRGLTDENIEAVRDYGRRTAWKAYNETEAEARRIIGDAMVGLAKAYYEKGRADGLNQR